MLPDEIKQEITKLNSQARRYRRYWSYYIGAHPVVYASEAMRELFQRANVYFTQNWCGVVINASYDRIKFKGFDSVIDEVNDTLDAMYQEQQLEILSSRVHLDVLVSGSGFVMFDKVDGVIRPYYNSPELISVKYDDNDENKMAFAIKMWTDGETDWLNVYKEDAIETWRKKSQKGSEDTYGYTFEKTEPNVFGRIPIVHYRINNSELFQVLPLQDAINMLFSNMMVMSEYTTFPLRYIITNSDVSTAETSPRTLLKIPKGMSGEESTQVGEFSVTSLEGHLSAIDKLSGAMAIISRTPKHYMYATGANEAAETLKVMEMPLINKVSQIQMLLKPKWVEFASYYVDAVDDVVVVWEPLESKDELREAEAAAKWQAVGLPLLTVLKRQGWGEDEIAQLISDMAEDTERKADFATEALRLAQLRLERDNNP